MNLTVIALTAVPVLAAEHRTRPAEDTNDTTEGHQ